MAPKRKNGVTAAAGSHKAAKPDAAGGNAIEVGERCPNFTVIDNDQEEFILHDTVKEKGAVIFVYPRCNTKGCTTQATGFRDHHEEFERAGYQVFGMSADNPTPQTNWKEKESLRFPLLCDKHKVALRQLGFLGTGDKVTRGHIVVGKKGIVQQWSPGLKPLDSVESALAFCIEKGKEGDSDEGEGETS